MDIFNDFLFRVNAIPPASNYFPALQRRQKECICDITVPQLNACKIRRGGAISYQHLQHTFFIVQDKDYSPKRSTAIFEEGPKRSVFPASLKQYPIWWLKTLSCKKGREYSGKSDRYVHKKSCALMQNRSPEILLGIEVQGEEGRLTRRCTYNREE